MSNIQNQTVTVLRSHLKPNKRQVLEIVFDANELLPSGQRFYFGKVTDDIIELHSKTKLNDDLLSRLKNAGMDFVANITTLSDKYIKSNKTIVGANKNLAKDIKDFKMFG